jgi:hypothetical protein
MADISVSRGSPKPSTPCTLGTFVCYQLVIFGGSQHITALHWKKYWQETSTSTNPKRKPNRCCCCGVLSSCRLAQIHCSDERPAESRSADAVASRYSLWNGYGVITKSDREGCAADALASRRSLWHGYGAGMNSDRVSCTLDVVACCQYK